MYEEIFEDGNKYESKNEFNLCFNILNFNGQIEINIFKDPENK